MIATANLFSSEVRVLSWFATASQKPPVRSIFDFACDEVIIAEGRYKGRRYRPDRQPFSGMLLKQIDSGRYNRFAITGCVQSGKTFTALVIPFMYHIFEMQEDVIVGVPQMEMAADKWQKEFLPSIKRIPKFAELLPESGKGSRGGKFESLRFKHGPEVRFMSGHGGDEKRSGHTARVLLATEVDKYDVPGESSRETDPVSQMEARTESYEDDARIYLECTVSVPNGRIWQEYINGTKSEIVCQCPSCIKWITPEKEQFTAHEKAKTEFQAEKLARFDCNECGKDISEHRLEMNRTAKVIHRGQSIGTDGEISGKHPETRTLGFRWNAWNNLFWSVPYLGRKEWKALNGLDDEENEESGSKKSLQFRWTTPFSLIEESVEIRFEHIQRRTASVDVQPRGRKPKDAKWTIIGADINKPVVHWTANSFRQSGSAHIIDYGTTGTSAYKIGFDKGIKNALKRLHERLGSGWSDQEYDMVLVDCRWKPNEVIDAIKELKDRRWVPFYGMGSGHIINQKYVHPKKRIKNDLFWIGPNCYMRVHKEHKIKCMHADANAVKTELAERLMIDGPIDAPGSISIFGSVDDQEHRQFFRHLSAEKQVQRFEKGKGWKLVWEAEHSANHWLDSTYMTIAGAIKQGFRFVPKETQGQVSSSISTREGIAPDGDISFFHNSFRS